MLLTSPVLIQGRQKLQLNTTFTNFNSIYARLTKFQLQMTFSLSTYVHTLSKNNEQAIAQSFCTFGRLLLIILFVSTCGADFVDIFIIDLPTAFSIDKHTRKMTVNFCLLFCCFFIFVHRIIHVHFQLQSTFHST